jgi:hypothetical protein
MAVLSAPRGGTMFDDLEMQSWMATSRYLESANANLMRALEVALENDDFIEVQGLRHVIAMNNIYYRTI